MNTQEVRGLTGLIMLYGTRMLGLFMVLPVITLYADHYTGSTPLLLGIAMGVYGLSQGLLQIPLGMLSDKVGRKAVILGGILMFLLGSVVAATAETITWLIIGRALQGAGAVASAIMALLSDLTTEQNRTKAMAAIGGSIGLSFALAMVLGPVLASIGGLSAIFWLTALLGVLGIPLLLFWIPSPVAINQISSAEALPAADMLRSTLANPELLRLNLGVFVLHMAQMASWISVPYLLKHHFQVALSSHWILYLSTMLLGFILMLPLIILGERRHKLKQVFLIGVLILAVAELILFLAADSFPVFAFGMLCFFTAFNLLEATLPSLVSKISPSGTRGTAMGVFSSSQFLGIFVGGSAGGYIAGQLGYEAVFVFAAAMALVWLAVAVSMAQPRHWSTVVINLVNYPAIAIDRQRLQQDCHGIEEVTLFPDRQLLYLKVDRQIFSQQALDQAMARYGAVG
jgi:MFS family permease